MMTFDYIALDTGGKEQHGQVEANDEREAVRTLRDADVFVVSVSEATEGDDGFDDLGWSLRRYLSVSPVDLVFLFRQTALMLRSGHTVVQALDANREMAVKNTLRRALAAMVDSIQGGGSLSSAIEAQGAVFPPLVAKLIEVGERSGEVDTILESIADGMEDSMDLKRQLIAALTYPGIVLLTSIGVSVALVGWVIPRFARFLTARNVELPPVTQFLLDLAAWFEAWGAIAGTLLLITVIGTLAAYTTRRGKQVLDGVLLRVPIIGGTIRAASLAQATGTLAMQLRSGITLLQSLSITADVVGNRVIGNAFAAAGERILAGQALSVALRSRVVPPLVRHLAAIGEKSGELDGAMSALGKFYHKDLQNRVKTLAAWVEPVLILFVGALVGTVYLAFFQAALKVSTG